MRNSKVLGALCTLLLAVGALTACGSDQEEGSTFVVGTDPNYVPFSYTDPDTKKMTGFDHAFAVALADEMDVTLEYEGVAWDGIIPAVNSGKIDAITSISITPERAKEVTFSEPHMKQTIVAVVPADATSTIKGFDDLKDMKLGVMGSTAAGTAVEQAGGLNVTTYNSPDEEYKELTLGRLDAVVIESPQAGYALETQYKGKLKIASQDLGGPAVKIGVAVEKGNDVLAKKINSAIDSLKKDGTYDKLIQQWFGDIDYEVPTQ